MENENVKLLVAAGLGAVSGLLLGMFIWGGDDKKGKLSKQLSSLSDIIRELEELDTKEAKDLKDKVKNILGGVEEILEGKDG
jgi:hypothetical protein